MNNDMTTDNMSNEEVIEVLKGIVFNSFDRTTPKERQALDLAIKALESPQGEWIKIDEEWYDYKCSVCGEKVRRLYPFCHCGADMRGDVENG